ncbi:MAG: SagB/ThcOx family dehydrogenase [Calditrichia bacterium]
MKSPVVEACEPPEQIRLPRGKYKLSRFTLFRPEADGFIIESPFSAEQVRLSGSTIFQILQVFLDGVEIETMLSGVGEKARPLVERIIEKCLSCGFLIPVSDDGISEDETGDLKTWEFHDLYFHSRSRIGRHQNAVGGTFRYAEEMNMPGLLRQPPVGKPIELFQPDMAALQQSDVSLTQALERRRTIRNANAGSVSSEELGEFLYRTSRITSVENYNNGFSSGLRVYPGGGGMYPLEVYPLISSCNGLKNGLYYYHPLNHNLTTIPASENCLENLLRDARSAGGLEYNPAVLFLITARFSRTAWKYQSIAYSLILKEVGCLFQTFYLVATAMNLAPCALGSGNSDSTSEAINRSYYLETSVGEFMLGPGACNAD